MDEDAPLRFKENVSSHSNASFASRTNQFSRLKVTTE